MGADIWMYAEFKKDGVWHLAGDIEKNPEYYPEENSEAQLYKLVEVYDTRNYNLFGILADVRNLNGHTLDNQKFDVIASPRGLLEDLSPEIQSWVKDWEDQYFSPSWLLLSEVLRFEWQRKVMRYEAMIDARVAHLFREDEPFPFSKWLQDVQMGYATYLKDGVTVRWTDTYAASVGEDFFEVINSLKQYGKPSRVRLVFWFNH